MLDFGEMYEETQALPDDIAIMTDWVDFDRTN
jgi:hypothetical protein